MREDMNECELLKQVVEENQTRKILEIMGECKDLDEAKKRIKALLNTA
ncbi:MAG: protein phosphatase [Lachnospiraceae bacterium]|nr:protein phosphatase [Lachnospiraceae bacterium]